MKSKISGWKLGVVALIAVWVVVGAAGLLLGASLKGTKVPLQKGNAAPDFALSDQFGHRHHLKDYKGRGVILAFLPDMEGLSRKQLRGLNSSIREFDTMGVKLFAITPALSAHTLPLHQQEKLSFPILSDPDGRVATLYNARTSRAPSGRINYVVGKDSEILMPVPDIQYDQHGGQMVAMVECCMDVKTAVAKDLGKLVPDFKLPLVDGTGEVSLYGDRKQRATVVLFFSSECPCSARYDDRNRLLATDYTSKGIRFVAINSSFGEKLADIQAHVKKAGFAFPILRDEGNVIADRFGAKVTPEVYVMDQKGILRYHGRVDNSRDPKFVTSNDMRNALDAILADRVPAQPDLVAFGCAIARRPIVETRAR